MEKCAPFFAVSGFLLSLWATLATLTVDSNEVAEQKLTRTIPFRVSADETFDVGEDTGTPVSEDYRVPFKFTGTLNKVVITLGQAALTPEDQKKFEGMRRPNAPPVDHPPDEEIVDRVRAGLRNARTKGTGQRANVLDGRARFWTRKGLPLGVRKE